MRHKSVTAVRTCIQLHCADVPWNTSYVHCMAEPHDASQYVASHFHRADTTGARAWLKRLAAEAMLSNAAVRGTEAELAKIMLLIQRTYHASFEPFHSVYDRGNRFGSVRATLDERLDKSRDRFKVGCKAGLTA